jgi:hypothetical protein
MSEADSIQIKAILNQAFDVWAAKRDEEDAKRKQEEKLRVLGGSIPAWVACVLSILGIVMLAGGTNQRVNDTERRVGSLEVRDNQRQQDYATILARLGNIEGKLDTNGVRR